MALLTKEQILGAQDLREEIVPVPEWGGEVRVRTITGTQRDEYEQALMASRTGDGAANLRNVRARLVACSIVGEDGQPLFGPDDVEALGAKSAAALDRVVAAASRLSALTAEDVAELGKPCAPTAEGSTTSA